jgi:hypothetical protein
LKVVAQSNDSEVVNSGRASYSMEHVASDEVKDSTLNQFEVHSHSFTFYAISTWLGPFIPYEIRKVVVIGTELFLDCFVLLYICTLVFFSVSFFLRFMFPLLTNDTGLDA